MQLVPCTMFCFNTCSYYAKNYADIANGLFEGMLPDPYQEHANTGSIPSSLATMYFRYLFLEWL